MNLDDKNNKYKRCIEVIQVAKDKNSLENRQGICLNEKMVLFLF